MQTAWCTAYPRTEGTWAIPKSTRHKRHRCRCVLTVSMHCIVFVCLKPSKTSRCVLWIACFETCLDLISWARVSWVNHQEPWHFMNFRKTTPHFGAPMGPSMAQNFSWAQGWPLAQPLANTFSVPDLPTSTRLGLDLPSQGSWKYLEFAGHHPDFSDFSDWAAPKTLYPSKLGSPCG